MMNWIVGLIGLVLAVWAIASILNSTATTQSKVLWIALVLIFPVIGFVIWYFRGPKSALK